MTERRSYDAVIVGTGQAGKPLAAALAEAGRRTAIVEREPYVGGSCINWGCTPTKTMVASARIAHLARRAADFGVEVGDVAVDVSAVYERKDDVVRRFREGSRKSLEETAGLDLLEGEAALLGDRSVRIERRSGGDLELDAEWIFLDTGTRATVPPIEGIDEAPHLDNRSILQLDELPTHLLIIGGGYVGVELGQMFRRFGSGVTLLQRGPQILSREDEDVAGELAEILRGEGAEILLDAEATSVRRHGEGIEVEARTADGDRLLRASHLLVAAGRTPNTDGLNAAAAGVELDGDGYVEVNARLETSAEGIFALGDVKGGPAFTHVSYDDFRIVRANLLEGAEASTAGRTVPYTVFTDPELGRVGLSEREARSQGGRIRVARLPMSRVARAIESGETRGFMKAVVDAETGEILGAAVLGLEGGEVISVLQMAMQGGLPYTVLRDAVLAHPTLSESLNNLFMTLD